MPQSSCTPPSAGPCGTAVAISSCTTTALGKCSWKKTADRSHRSRLAVLGDVAFDLGTVDDVEQRVLVSRGLRNRLRRAELVAKDPDAAARRPLATPFVPSEGTKALRRYEFREAYPRVYAARHVATEVVVMLVGVLGIGALAIALTRSVLAQHQLVLVARPPGHLAAGLAAQSRPALVGDEPSAGMGLVGVAAGLQPAVAAIPGAGRRSDPHRRG